MCEMEQRELSCLVPKYISLCHKSSSSSCFSPLARKTITRLYKKGVAHIENQQRKDFMEGDARFENTFSARPSTLSQVVRKRKKNSLNMGEARERRNRAKDKKRRKGKSDAAVSSWWSVFSSKSKDSQGSDSELETRSMSELLWFDESKLYDVHETTEKRGIAKVVRKVFQKRASHHLLGTQFSSDATLWIIECIFRDTVTFSYRQMDAIRSVYPEAFSDMIVTVQELEGADEEHECGSPFITVVTIKLVKMNVKRREHLVFFPSAQ